MNKPREKEEEREKYPSIELPDHELLRNMEARLNRKPFREIESEKSKSEGVKRKLKKNHREANKAAMA